MLKRFKPTTWKAFPTKMTSMGMAGASLGYGIFKLLSRYITCITFVQKKFRATFNGSLHENLVVIKLMN